MFGYYLGLAWRSLRRSPVLTALMVLAIGLGIGASMTMITVLHVMDGDPLPGRSGSLFSPHLDPLPLNYRRNPNAPDASASFTWPDAMALVKAHRAEHQAAMAGGNVLVHPPREVTAPFYADGHFTTSEFFAMFGVSFAQGSGWSAVDDEGAARVVVLSAVLSGKLFGTQDAVGRSVRMGDASLRVIGVTKNWKPRPMFYGVYGVFSDTDMFFLPLSTAVALKLSVSDDQSSWKAWGGDMKSPSLTWLQVWVQLKNLTEAATYRQFLVDYAAQQKVLGRFQRPPNSATLTPLMAYLEHRNLVPSDVRLQTWLALGFLLVCMLNIVALLLTKFLRRAGEVSVRRALGARRRDIFTQLGTESALIGFAGGLLGMMLAQFGLWQVRQRPDDYARLAHMDIGMLIGTVVLAVAVSVLAGLLPAWRACRITPVSQLKTQ